MLALLNLFHGSLLDISPEPPLQCKCFTLNVARVVIKILKDLSQKSIPRYHSEAREILRFQIMSLLSLNEASHRSSIQLLFLHFLSVAMKKALKIQDWSYRFSVFRLSRDDLESNTKVLHCLCAHCSTWTVGRPTKTSPV